MLEKYVNCKNPSGEIWKPLEDTSGLVMKIYIESVSRSSSKVEKVKLIMNEVW